MTSHSSNPQNETRPVFRLSESVPGDEPVKEPVFPCWMWHQIEKTIFGRWFPVDDWDPLMPGMTPIEGGYLYWSPDAAAAHFWRPSQPERAGDKAESCPDCFGGLVPVFCGDTTGEGPCPDCNGTGLAPSPSSPVTESAKPDERAMACANALHSDYGQTWKDGFNIDEKSPYWPLWIEAEKERARIAAIIQPYLAPAPSTPEGLREAVARNMSCQPHGSHMTENWWKAYKRDYPGAWTAALQAADYALQVLAPFIPASTTEGRK